MHKVLVASPRTGSSWVSMYGEASPWTNKIRTLVKEFDTEYFRYYGSSAIFTASHHIPLNTEQKIAILESERLDGREYFVKIMVRDFYREKEILDFYKRFYNRAEKIKLYNYNAWRVCLSWSYQYYTKWVNPHVFLPNSKPNFPYSADKKFVQFFAKEYSRYINFDTYDVSLNYHDLNDDILSNYFQVPSSFQTRFKHREPIDYESNLIDAQKVKNMLHEELKNNGLQISDYVL